MKNKFFSFILTVLLIIPYMFILTACNNKNSEIDFRVNGEYIQWTNDGVNWEDLISIDNLKGKQGIQGIQGIPGKSIEIQSTKTHIQWRYAGESTWNNLVSYEDLKEKEEIIDVEELKTNAFNLFSSQLSTMNSSYEVIYDYADKYIVESFVKRLHIGIDNSSFDAIMQFSYNSQINGENLYSLNLIPYSYTEYTPDGKQTYTPNNRIVGSCRYDINSKKYIFENFSGQIFYPKLADEITDFQFVSFLKGFSKQNMISCEFNNNGDCKILFNYYSQNSPTPYQNIDYLYEFNVTKDGNIEKCYVYEKDFLNPYQKGDLHCKISYNAKQSLIDSTFLNEVLEKLKETHSNITNWYDAFGYTLTETE